MFHSDLTGLIVAEIPTPAVAAADATAHITGWAAPKKINVAAIRWRPLAAITGADTDSNNLNIVDGGVDGDGSDELGNVNFASGTDAAAGEVIDLYAPATPVTFAGGNLFKLQAEKVGSGLGLPAGVLLVEFYNA